MNIVFFQCQEDYNNAIYLPYSSGILWTYLKQHDIIKNNIKLIDIYFEKIDPYRYLELLQSQQVDVALFSNYGWNTAYHLSIAKLLKEHFPKIKIIIGGPNAQQDQAYMRQHHYIDFSVWGEGEETLLELFSALITDTTLDHVDGICYLENDNFVLTNQRQRKKILDIPSPYLEGIFDSYFDRYSYNFMPVWETNRGCPYHCTFCDLGADYYNKLHLFSTERLLAEIDWFVDKRIEYIEIADANFGILDRDLDLVKKIRSKYLETGYPQKINATWAKNSPDRVFEMSKILDSMNRGGVTLALQSSNKSALDNIKRFNIVNDKLETIAKKYIENNIQTYHDFILGLPGETLSSWMSGLYYIIDINPEGWIFGHPLEAYKNTEFSDPAYIEKYQLKFAQTPQVSFFAKRNPDIIIEQGNYVIEHSTMSREEYIEAFLFKWFLITNHSLGWTNYLGQHLEDTPSKFYRKLYDYIKSTPCLIQSEYLTTKDFLTETIETGKFWGRQMFGNSDVYWEYESASCIIYESNRDQFFQDIENFLSKNYTNYQIALEKNKLQLIKYSTQQMYKTYKEFCVNVYWYGRRKKAWKV